MNFQYSKVKYDSLYRTMQNELLRGCTEVAKATDRAEYNGKNGI
jgi:hypothetical protein